MGDEARPIAWSKVMHRKIGLWPPQLGDVGTTLSHSGSVVASAGLTPEGGAAWGSETGVFRIVGGDGDVSLLMADLGGPVWAPSEGWLGASANGRRAVHTMTSKLRPW